MYCEQAYMESQTKSDRVRAFKSTIRTNGKFDGRKPYGYRVVGTEKYNKHLEPDPVTGPVVRDIVSWYLAGDTLAAIAHRLDAQGAPVPNHRRPGKLGWSPATLHNILTSESLIGKRRNAQGQITHQYTPLITMETWRKLQALIKLNGKKRGAAAKPKGMLADVTYCGKCKRVLHHRRIPDRKYPDYIWYGYRCDGTAKSPSRCKVMVSAKDLEPWVDLWFTESGPFAGTEVVETLPMLDTRQDQIDEIDLQIDALDKSASDYLDSITQLVAQRKALAEAPPVQDIDERPTGITVGEYWPTLTAEEKRQYLLDSGTKIYVDKADGKMHPWITGNPYRVLGTIKQRSI